MTNKRYFTSKNERRLEQIKKVRQLQSRLITRGL